MHDLQPAPPIRGANGALSGRQRQVLGLLTHRLTNAEIASELGVSLDGAKWHVSELLGALDVESRQEAARWYRDYARRLSA